MKRFFSFFLLFVFFVSFLGCEGANKITGPSPITPGNTGNTEIKDSDLYKYNAAFDGGYTNRWDKNTITVYDGIGLSEIQGFLNEWNQYLNGRRLLLRSDSYADININYGERAQTNVNIYSNHTFSRAFIEMDNNPHTDNFKGAVKHELGHAIGFNSHTSNGGLMDAYGNGIKDIDSVVAGVVKKLYELPPGTKVVPG
ncbi:MAG: hypothetical protein AAB474_02150 [Patescibacteria group bacterium]